MRRMMPAMRAFCAFAVLLVVALVLAAASNSLLVEKAWADEAETGTVDTPDADNTVNMNQLPDSSFLYDTDIATLDDADAYHDSQIVQVRGQAVGDIIAVDGDPGYCWVTLQEIADHPTAVVSVYMTREQAKAIDTLGRYGTVGTTLQVRGTYHLDCQAHQGLSDIHAEEVTRLEKGREVALKPHPAILVAAGCVCLVGAALFFIYRHRVSGSK